MGEPAPIYLIDLNYARPELVEENLAGHRDFLQKHYDSGYFIFSGPKQPRAGGIILSRGRDLAEVEAIMATDPFLVNGVAEMVITAVVPRMTDDAFAKVIG